VPERSGREGDPQPGQIVTNASAYGKKPLGENGGEGEKGNQDDFTSASRSGNDGAGKKEGRGGKIVPNSTTAYKGVKGKKGGAVKRRYKRGDRFDRIRWGRSLRGTKKKKKEGKKVELNHRCRGGWKPVQQRQGTGVQTPKKKKEQRLFRYWEGEEETRGEPLSLTTKFGMDRELLGGGVSGRVERGERKKKKKKNLPAAALW